MFDSIASLFCALGVAWTGYTLAFIVANKWADQWYNADGSAHHCEECSSGYLVNYPVAVPKPFSLHTGNILACGRCGAPVGLRDECVADAMTLGRGLGPLLAVGVVLCLI